MQIQDILPFSPYMLSLIIFSVEPLMLYEKADIQAFSKTYTRQCVARTVLFEKSTYFFPRGAHWPSG